MSDAKKLPTIENELQAMRDVWKILETLEPGAGHRVIQWAREKLSSQDVFGAIGSPMFPPGKGGPRGGPMGLI